MPSLFVSHSSQDAGKTGELVGKLRAEGFEALFVDFDPDVGIPAGRNWERELYSQLRRADGVLFLATPASTASRWCFAELSLARSVGKPVFPLLVAGTERLPLLADVQWIDMTSNGEQAYSRLVADLRRARFDPADALGWDPTRCPYPGLDPFAAEDAAVFFGREVEIDRLLQLLQPTLQHAAGRFVGIVGPSGSGKSSLLRAGLLPRLQRLPERWVVLPALRPGQDPLKSLARSLTEAFAARGQSLSPADLAARLERGPEELVALAGELAETGPGQPKVLVVIDQAEELVTRTGPRDQQRFLGLLRGALSEASPLWAVATLRAEFLATDPERAGLAGLIDDPLLVEPLGRNRLAEVIARPAQRAGLEFAPGLVERMVEETTGGDALPLLAYTLRELYERVGPERTVGIADYEALGGVVGALQRRAGQLLDELARRGRGALVLPTLLKLAGVEGDAEPTRRRVRRDVLSSDEQAVVQAFVDARLLTSDISSDGEGEEATVEVAHEALLRQWTPLRDAIEDSRASLRLRSELEREAADWDQGGRDESYLLRGGRLATFEEWAGTHDGELTAMERELLRASRALANRELEAARRSNRRLRRLAAGLATVLVLALVAAGVAVAQTRNARQEALVALSRQRAVQAWALLDTRPEPALLLTLEGVRAARTLEAVSVLQDGLSRPHHVATQLLGHTGTVSGVAFSPDSRVLASVGGTVRLWDVASGLALGAPLSSHVDTGVAFSPDGRTLSSSGRDGTVRLWDVASRRAVGALRHGDWVEGVAFSPDGKTLASSGRDGTVRLWDVATRRALGDPLRGHTGAVWGVAFSPDGKTLASAGGDGDGTVRLWDVGTRRTLGAPLIGQVVAFSADGGLLASSGQDGTVRLWDVISRRELGAPLRGHTSLVNGVAFSPDGKTLASSGRDGTVRLWDVATRRALGDPLRGHPVGVSGVAFSPDGRVLASVGFDRRVRLWDVASSRPLGGGYTGAESGVAFSPDGSVLALASGDNMVQLWDVTIAALVSDACRLANRNLSRSEWNEFVGRDMPYVRMCPSLPSGPGAPPDAPGARYPEGVIWPTS